MSAHVKPTKPSAPTIAPGPAGIDQPETHGPRLERLAAEAESVASGDGLGKLSWDERRRRLFA